MAENKDSVSRWIPPLLFLTASYLAWFVSWFAVKLGMPFWYQTLAKPIWNPPTWTFAPVWTILYGLIGVAGWLVWIEPKPASRVKGVALALFGAQLVLTMAWNWTFFGWQRLGPALAEIAILDAVCSWAVLAFWKVRPKAGLLLLPYLGWLLFTTGLNLAIWRLNR